MGPEKRLPLALFLCFIVLVVLQFRNAPEQPKDVGGEAAAAADAVGGATPDAAGVPDDSGAITKAVEVADAGTGDIVAPAPAPDDEKAAGGAEPRDEWVEFGTDGERGHMWVHFSSLGGSVAEIRLAEYAVRLGLSEEERSQRENMVPIVQPGIERERTLQTLMLRPGVAANALFKANVETVHWDYARVEDGAVFTHRDPSGIVIEKRISKVPGEYHLRLALSVSNSNEAHTAKNVSFGLVASVGMPEDGQDSFYQQPKAIAANVKGSLSEEGPDVDGDPRQDGLMSGALAYFGTHNKYFVVVLRPENDSSRQIVRDSSYMRVYDMDWAAANPAEYLNGFRDILVEGNLDIALPAPEQPARVFDYVLFAGPKDPGQFTESDAALEKIIESDLGFFDGIAGVILGFLRFLHGIVGNWGWAIILLTLTVRMMLFPLNRRMQTSMARHATKMKRVQPKIDAVKKKFENDPKKLREEQAKIFQTEGVMPPLGGCLPMLLQIPIFFGLFSALRVAFDLRQEPFLGWITDLSQPDRLAEINLNTHLPFIGVIPYFNLLPILMVVLWVGQQRVMPKPQTDNEQAKQMQRIMMWMPIMFGFFLYNYAAGLSLYMITTSLFGILEMTVIRKIWPIDDAEKPKKKSKFMARIDALQKQALAAQEAQKRAGGKQGGSKKRR